MAAFLDGLVGDDDDPSGSLLISLFEEPTGFPLTQKQAIWEGGSVPSVGLFSGPFFLWRFPMLFRARQSSATSEAAPVCVVLNCLCARLFAPDVILLSAIFFAERPGPCLFAVSFHVHDLKVFCQMEQVPETRRHDWARSIGGRDGDETVWTLSPLIRRAVPIRHPVRVL